MALTLGTFTKQNDGSFAGTLKTLNITADLPDDRRGLFSTGEQLIHKEIIPWLHPIAS